MTDDELIECAQALRDGILAGRESRMMCFAICAPLVSVLNLHGIEADVVEGDLGECNHFWIRLADGRVLDPTADQFNWMLVEKVPPIYLGPPMSLHREAAGKCAHEPVDSYAKSVRCGHEDLGCAGGFEWHCKHCGVYITDCPCGDLARMSVRWTG